ncbi:MAG: alcohol dehydrogenase catalytic domain-containing protein [Acidobacteriota bacterium]
MKAVIFKGLRSLALEERPEPTTVQGDDVVLRVHSTGICGTDRNIYLGNFPAAPGVILGHESVGVVEATGPDVRDLRAGDRVIVNPTLYCGTCGFCRRGAFNHCDHKVGTEVGVDRDGTMADRAVLAERFLYKIPDSMSFDRAVFVEPLACVLNNAHAADLRAEDDVVVLGGGPIGVIFAMLAERAALRVTLVEADPFRVDFARSRFERVVDASSEPTVEAAIAANAGRKPRVVIDTTGVLLQESIDLVSKGGTIVLMGFNAGYQPAIKPLYLVNNGISIVGAGDYNAPIFPSAIDLADALPLDDLITHRFSLDRHDEAFGLLVADGAVDAGYGAMKILVESSAA